MTGKREDSPGKALGFIRRYVDDHDLPPTVREVQVGCGFSSTSVAMYNLRRLEKGGHIRLNPGQARGIELLDRRERVVRVPLYGTIAAGSPIDVPGDRDPDEYVEVAPDVVRGRENVFALRVKGDSMIEDGIFDGDVVILQAAQTADNGETVAAWLSGQAATTLKRFYAEGPRVRLQPRNPTMDPIYADAEDVQVQAKLLKVESSA